MDLIEAHAGRRFPAHRIDAHQRDALHALEALLGELTAPAPRAAWWSRRKPARVNGLYLWGGVGRGKTWLMDLFFEVLEQPAPQRFHFHRFMQQVHAEMRQLQGQANPMIQVAKRIAADGRVLCLDEFNVIDIADAVIIAGLLEGLFAQGVTLVATSNQPPEGLYRGGIQRASFLPAIDLLQQHTRVVELGGELDYRRRVAESAGVYHWPLDETVDAGLQATFERLRCEPLEQDGEVRVMSRDIPFRYRAGGMVWFDFEALCGPPRSQYDYIEVARNHHTVFISDIPRLDGSKDDCARRFILLVDEFYDRRVKLMASASARPEALYCGERLAFEFQRTASRLQEMQTADYLSLPHRG